MPPQCLGCEAMVEAPGSFCADCFRRVGFVTAPCCDHCGRPFAHAGEGDARSVCWQCRQRPPAWSRARGALRYDTASKEIILPFKYGDRDDHAAALAAFMARAGAPLLADAELLVPVPLHRRRLIGRRYNQSALLARALARRSGRPVLVDALIRTRATKPLADMGAAAREAQVAGAFALREKHAAAIVGRRVLLIDDVLTSGATSGACTRVLLAGGARAVDVLVAARVDAPEQPVGLQLPVGEPI